VPVMEQSQETQNPPVRPLLAGLAQGPARVVGLATATVVAAILLDNLLATVDPDASVPIAGLIHTLAVTFLAPFTLLVGDPPHFAPSLLAVPSYLVIGILTAVLAHIADARAQRAEPGLR
jgi:drug/metabolite transporter (DMT)-like permease